MTLTLRTATAADQPLIARSLFAAWQWRHPWDEDAFQDHLAAGSPDTYLDGFGRKAGDAGIIAEEVTATTEFAGAAWYRFFTDRDHRAGFVSEDVPELSIAVEPVARGQGVGRRLLRELRALAMTQGVPALSLHVSSENAVAKSLYRSLGFEVVHDHQGRGSVMLIDLQASDLGR